MIRRHLRAILPHRSPGCLPTARSDPVRGRRPSRSSFGTSRHGVPIRSEVGFSSCATTRSWSTGMTPRPAGLLDTSAPPMPTSWKRASIPSKSVTRDCSVASWPGLAPGVGLGSTFIHIRSRTTPRDHIRPGQDYPPLTIRTFRPGSRTDRDHPEQGAEQSNPDRLQYRG